MAIDRRLFIRNMLVGAGIISIFPQELLASNQSAAKHPLTEPNAKFKGECQNCGMKRSMWPRTWHTYTSTGRSLEVCSLNCLAESALASGTTPNNVQVALYLVPEKNCPVEIVSYVIGSQANGTMAMKSKLAFATRQKARTYARQYGGSIGSFSDAYQVAMNTIKKENQMIS